MQFSPTSLLKLDLDLGLGLPIPCGDRGTLAWPIILLIFFFEHQEVQVRGAVPFSSQLHRSPRIRWPMANTWSGFPWPTSVSFETASQESSSRELSGEALAQVAQERAPGHYSNTCSLHQSSLFCQWPLFPHLVICQLRLELCLGPTAQSQLKQHLQTWKSESG